jgi:hypothetical protein
VAPNRQASPAEVRDGVALKRAEMRGLPRAVPHCITSEIVLSGAAPSSAMRIISLGENVATEFFSFLVSHASID